MHTLFIKNQKGFTLIEVLAAAIILGIVIVSFASISQYANLADYRSGIRAEALQMAEEKLVELRSTLTSSDLIGSYNETYTRDAYTIDVRDIALSDTIGANYPATQKRVTVHAIVLMTNGTSLESRLLTVTVSWGG